MRIAVTVVGRGGRLAERVLARLRGRLGVAGSRLREPLGTKGRSRTTGEDARRRALRRLRRRRLAGGPTHEKG